MAPGRFKLAKTARVRSARDFETIRRARRTVSDDTLAIAFRRNHLPETRLGLAVSIRGIGAVTRNRIKRVVREAFRLHRAEFPTGWDLVVSSRNAIKATEFVTVEASLCKLVARIAALPSS